MLKTAVVGCGAISKVHFEAIKSLSQITKLVAVCDTKIENTEKISAETGCKIYSSLDEMLDNEQIDVLHICTPHFLHVPMAKAALVKNINVIMEKPPAISFEQYDELKKASEGKKLGICFQNRYNGSVVRAKELLESGQAGKVLGARAFVTWSRGGKYYTESDWRGKLDKEGGGVLINQSIHTLDLITYLLGTPTSVISHSENYHLKGIINEEDTMISYLTFEDFSAIFFATTAFCKDAPIMLEIVCENCSIRLEGNTLNVTYKDGSKETKNYTELSATGKACWGSSHNKLISEFYNSVLNDTPFAVDLDSTLPSFKTMMSFYKSSKTNEKVTL